MDRGLPVAQARAKAKVQRLEVFHELPSLEIGEFGANDAVAARAVLERVPGHAQASSQTARRPAPGTGSTRGTAPTAA